MWSTKTTMMFSTSWEHETLFRSVLVRLDHSAKISARGRREPPEATGRNRKSGVGTHLGVVRWYGFASAWHPSAPVERFGPKTATPPKMAQPSLHRHPPVVRLRHRRRRNAFDETARETRRNPMALAVGGGQSGSLHSSILGGVVICHKALHRTPAPRSLGADIRVPQLLAAARCSRESRGS